MGGTSIGVAALLAAALVLGGACSDDSADAGSDAALQGAERDGGAGTGSGAGRGASGGGSQAGSGSHAGSGGASGAGGRAGSSEPTAGRGGGNTAGDSGGGTGGESGEGGSAGAVDNHCSSDADCVLCSTPLSAEMPCCDGCPTVMSQAQCDAMEAAGKGDCQQNLIPVCPAILCVNPGSPKCDNGMCVSVAGLPEQ